MSTPREIPRDHPLRKLFRWATRNAFRFNPQLRTDAVEAYFSEWLLGRFVHADNLFRIRNARGRRLHEVAGMLAEGLPPNHQKTYPQLALHQHVGDYVLFMGGLFPEGLLSRAPESSDRLLVKVGSLFYPCASPLDYFIYQGRVSYGKAAEYMRELSEETAAVLERLSEELSAYVNVMSLVRLNLEASSYFRTIQGIIGRD